MKYRFMFLYKMYRHRKHGEEKPVDRKQKPKLNQDIECVEEEDEAEVLLRQLREQQAQEEENTRRQVDKMVA